VENINLNWLKMLITLISLHWIFVVTRALIVVLGIQSQNLVSIIDLYSISIFLIFTTFLVIKGMHQNKFFTGIEMNTINGSVKLTETQIEQYTEMIANYMKMKKPYLVPSITIDEISEDLSIPSWQLSHVINKSFRENFFNFMNEYRIEEAKKRLEDPEDTDRTILEILYESGFNSKSTFNHVFKQHTGMTPSEFKRHKALKIVQ
jgi:AraC-like DNA-binding protein